MLLLVVCILLLYVFSFRVVLRVRLHVLCCLLHVVCLPMLLYADSCFLGVRLHVVLEVDVDVHGVARGAEAQEAESLI